MAFEYEQQQVRLRLSRYAEEIIQHDMLTFNEPKRNTFINTILENFYDTANSSINLRLNEYEDTLNTTLSSIKNKKDTIKLLLNAEKNRLEQLACSYDKPYKNCSNNIIRLRNNFYNYLTDTECGTDENLYNNYTLPKYLRTLIEEYSRLPYIQREQIYYKSKFTVINSTIDNQKQILISTSHQNNPKYYYVLPYKILTDTLSTSSYLTGYAYIKDTEKCSMSTCSFKISTVNIHRIEKSKSGYIHPKQLKILQNDIESLGVQFLSSENIELKVRFSKHGLNSFNHQINFRPTPIKKEGDVYTFNCSLVQARYYFFKFGRHAEILQPEELRKEFKKKYNDAYKLYL